MAEPEEGAWLHAAAQVTIVELARSSGMPEELLRELVGYGALEPADPGAAEWCFSAACVARVRRAARLRGDLELDTPALALVLSFLDRIERLEAELRHLHAQLAAPHR
ncbi:MAG TPA: chaperone modulator CbpM [Usitatibacter sp.]|nr:chaperone modulator CbpM [Usitatibacter sp.]